MGGKAQWIESRARVFLKPDRAWKIPEFAQRLAMGQADVARSAASEGGEGLDSLFLTGGRLDLIDDPTLVEMKRRAMEAVAAGRQAGRKPMPRIEHHAKILGVPLPLNFAEPEGGAPPHITAEQAIAAPGWRPGKTITMPPPENPQARYLMVGMPPDLSAAVQTCFELAAKLPNALLPKSRAGILMLMIEQGRRNVIGQYETKDRLEKAANAARRKELKKTIETAQQRGWPLPPELEAEAGRLGLIYRQTEMGILEPSGK